jgi:pentatricopeptide repeat protein
MNPSRVGLACRRSASQAGRQKGARRCFISLNHPTPSPQKRRPSQDPPLFKIRDKEEGWKDAGINSGTQRRRGELTSLSDGDVARVQHEPLLEGDKQAGLPTGRKESYHDEKLPAEKRRVLDPQPNPFVANFHKRSLLERRKGRHSPGDAGDQLEALFEATLRQSPVLLYPELSPYQHASTLKLMLEDAKVPVLDSWQYFLQHFGPGTRLKISDLPRGYDVYWRELFQKITSAKSNEEYSASANGVLPTFPEICSIYSRLGILHGQDWTDMMFLLISRIMASKRAPGHMAYKALFKDLLNSWKLVFRAVNSSSLIDRAYEKRGVEGAFALLTPDFPPSQTANVPLVACATLLLLTQNNYPNVALAAKPLKESIVMAAQIPDCLSQLLKSQRKDARRIFQVLEENWTKIMEVTTKTKNDPSFMANIDTNILDAVVKKRDGARLEMLWSRYVTATSPQRDSSHPVTQVLEWHCNDFIRSFMAVKMSNHAIDVWNYMVENGLPPSAKTWAEMVAGCRVSRDCEALEGIWSRMMELKVIPTRYCWTQRILALADSHRYTESIQALDEMGRLWLKTARTIHGEAKKLKDLQLFGDFEAACKPDIELVNEAVKIFIRKSHSEEASRILAWAGKFGIHANAFTYRILLEPLIKEGMAKEATALLKHMENDGIQASAGIFTTILEEAFRGTGNLSHEEQLQIVGNVFSAMEGAGLKASRGTYNEMVLQLLSTSGNMGAVNALLKRMASVNMKPDATMYTNLVNYYFRQDVPDLDAIRALTERAKTSDGIHKNWIFWDILIRGYAKAGDPESAMRILGQMRSNPLAHTVRFGTYNQLVTTLVEKDEWDTARDLVKSILKDKSGLATRTKTDEQRFWGLVRTLDLIPKDVGSQVLASTEPESEDPQNVEPRILEADSGGVNGLASLS